MYYLCKLLLHIARDNKRNLPSPFMSKVLYNTFSVDNQNAEILLAEIWHRNFDIFENEVSFLPNFASIHYYSRYYITIYVGISLILSEIMFN